MNEWSTYDTSEDEHKQCSESRLRGSPDQLAGEASDSRRGGDAIAMVVSEAYVLVVLFSSVLGLHCPAAEYQILCPRERATNKVSAVAGPRADEDAWVSSRDPW